MQGPMLGATCFFSGGIILGRYLSLDLTTWLLLAGAAFLINIFYLGCKKRIHPLILFLCIFLVGAFWYAESRAPQDYYNDCPDCPLTGEGIVLTYPRRGEYSQTFLVAVTGCSGLGENPTLRGCAGLEKMLLRAPNKAEEVILPGMRLSFSGLLFRPEEARNPGAFDYRDYLANQRVFYGLDCTRGTVTVGGGGNGFRTLAAQGREKVSRYLSEVLPEEERSLLLGLLFGDVSGVGDEAWEAYRRVGIVHLFAVSGYNIAFVLGVTWFLGSLFSRRPLWRLFCGIFVLLAYYYMVGWSASIVRASLMAFLALLALCLARKQDIINSLALAALLILIVNPGEIFQAGFQLSFAATAGIIYLTPELMRRGAGNLLAPTLAAQLATIPLTVWHFHQISLLAPLLNIIATIISGAATVLSLIGCLLTWSLPVLAAPLFIVAGLMMYALSNLALLAADLRFAGLAVPEVSPYFILLGYLFLLLLPHFRRLGPAFPCIKTRLKLLAVAVFLLGCIIFIWPGPSRLEVIFLDVGQGDSIFIRTPGGRTCLIDGGGSVGSDYPVGLKVVKPYLESRGINKLDFMVMSHNDIDHSEGLSEILPSLQVGLFLMPPEDEQNKIEQIIRELCLKKGIARQELRAGQRLLLDEQIWLEVLNPLTKEATPNNNSLVFRLVYREAEWLLTGDIENSIIEKILERSDCLTADILKLPHHGSISSYHEEFYRAVEPQAVVVSVGKNNFNHPHPEVKAYFVDRQIPFYATAEHGAVITESDGRRIRIRTMR